jgi:hypothetical protein
MKWNSSSHRVMQARADVRSLRTERRSARWAPSHSLDGLEPRLVLTATGATPPIAMLSATQSNSRSITIDYQVN